MARFGVFLRAVNVGGTGKLPMEELRRICVDCGFVDVKTYIASGNVALSSELDAAEIAIKLEAALQTYAGKAVGVFVRSAAELAYIAAQNPFPKVAGSKVTAIFLDGLASEALCSGLRGQADEEIMAGAGVIYVHYPNGLGRSKLRILGAEHGSARNMNTVAKMVALTS